MRLIRRLTDSHRIIKTTLQSLPVILVAIAFVIYGLTFLPLSQGRMTVCTALVKYVSYYEIEADGKPEAWFRTFGNSLSPCNLSTDAGKDVADSTVITGVWINRYDFFPSCKGRILIPVTDTLSHKTLSAANKNISLVLQRTISDIERRISKFDREEPKLRYYLSTHNVSDEGYNVMAACSAVSDSSRKEAEQLLTLLKNLALRPEVSIRHIEKYTLLYSDAYGKTVRKPCVDLTKAGTKRFHVIQTEDRKKPRSASALYFHRWLSSAVTEGNMIFTAAYFGSKQPGFSTDSLRTGLSSGMIKKNGVHNVPVLFAPDGSPVFTKGGRFAGITFGGAVIPAQNFNFGFNDLLE